jgi:hypothetical protein
MLHEQTPATTVLLIPEYTLLPEGVYPVPVRELRSFYSAVVGVSDEG